MRETGNNLSVSPFLKQMVRHLKFFIQWFFLILSVVLIVLFLYFSNGLVKSLGEEENEKMRLLSNAYESIISADPGADLPMESKIIEGNTTIPFILTAYDNSLLDFNNIHIPFYETWNKTLVREDTIAYLQKLIPELKEKGNFFEINIPDNIELMEIEEESMDGDMMEFAEMDANIFKQYLYYDESALLQQLHYYPYIQLMAVIVLILLFYFMLVSRKRAEQNRVWVGLSKETAHQLGTPIQSLMGWVEYFRNYEAEGLETADITTEVQEAAAEMDKDVKRLHVVADRFSKIGSEPKLETTDLRQVIQGVVDYMQKRASQHIHITAKLPDESVEAEVCAPLFSWVIENLCKNAIDAQDKPEEQICVTLRRSTARRKLIIDVNDNGKGIPKKKWKTVFNAGYTTKTRGWGLGLALVKRIIEEYHHGRIYVKSSTVGLGTTFRIEL